MDSVTFIPADVKVIGSPYKTFGEYHTAIRGELEKSAESFVKVGYLLKVARDTNVLAESSYDNYLDYAREEFGLDPSTVSRFININSRYSADGNSNELDEKYKGYGRAKLQEMLTLPDFLAESLSPELSKSEIHTIKQEYDEEQAITPLEVMTEPDQRTEETDLQRFMYKLLKSETELFKTLYEFGSSTGEIIDILLPDDVKIYIARPEGLGKLQLKFTRDSDTAELLNIRSGEKSIVTDDEVAEAVSRVLSPGLSEFLDYEAGYEKKYGEPFPKEEKIAPVQPAKSKVTVAKDKPGKQKTAQNKQETVQKSSESVQKPAESVKISAETSESGKTDAGFEPLTTAPIAPDHQPVPLPEAGQGTDAPGEEKTGQAEGEAADNIPENRINTPAEEDSGRAGTTENMTDDRIAEEEDAIRARYRTEADRCDDHGLITSALIACDVLRDNWNGFKDGNPDTRLKVIMNKTCELLELAQEMKRRDYAG